MINTPFYDPEKSYEENYKDGPFGAFSDGLTTQAEKIVENKGEPQASFTKSFGGPQYDFFGYKVFLPFGIPAGPLINGKFVESALNKGFDIVVYKTVRSRVYPSHEWPNILAVELENDLTPDIANGKLKATRIFKEPLSITNSFGVPSADPEFWQKDIRDVLKNVKKGQIVVGAFQGTKTKDGDTESFIDDFRVCASFLKETGVKVMEVNLSCPNEGTNNLLCYDTEKSVRVLKVIKDEIKDIPLVIKIGYFKDELALRDFVEKVGNIVQGISAINTISAEIVDENGFQALPGAGRLRSGVCGYGIKWAGLEMVGKLKKLREELGYKYTIIGVGGVSNADDFFEYRNAGADIVMSATGAMWNPYLAKEIKEKLL
jgi:dihydroorotate dehydrogenase